MARWEIEKNTSKKTRAATMLHGNYLEK